MKVLLVSAVVAALIVLGVLYYVSLPVIQVSNTTQQCVRVIPESAGTCENQPKKYYREWVK